MHLVAYLYLSLLALSAETNPHFRARPDGNNIVLESPYGRRVFFGPMNFSEARSYRLSVALSDLRKDKPVSAGDPEAMHNFKTNADALLADAENSLPNSGPAAAIRLVEQALAANPRNVRALMMKGSLLYLQGQKEGALTAWREAFALDPANHEIKQVLEKYQ